MMYVRTLINMLAPSTKISVYNYSESRAALNRIANEILNTDPNYGLLEVQSIRIMPEAAIFVSASEIDKDNYDDEEERSDIIELLYHCNHDIEIGIYENEGNNFFMSGTVREMSRHFGQGDIGKRYIVSKIWLENNRMNISIKYK